MHAWRWLPHPIRWVIVATVGATLIVLGLVFMVLPGPGIPLVIAGFVILASEFAWAELVVQRMRRDGDRLAKSFMERLRTLRNRG
jgi:hypothetical protein